MADTKISALPASTTPLAGTEILPIVQGGATQQVSVANLTTGRAISATQITLTTGNLIVANGQGIDFSATPGTGTSELLADYEEGTWTPSLASNTISSYSFSSSSSTYTKVGRMVTIQGTLTINGVPGSGSFVLLYGLPFAPSNNAKIVGNFSNGVAGDGFYRNGPSGNWIFSGATYCYALQYGLNSATLVNAFLVGDTLGFTLTYQT